MTNEQILKKAIEKAVKNGWKPTHRNPVSSHWAFEEIVFNHKFAKAFWGEKWKYKLRCPNCKEVYNFFTVTEQGFPCAKYCNQDATKLVKVKDFVSQNWKYNLQQMVLEEEPLKYIEKFL